MILDDSPQNAEEIYDLVGKYIQNGKKQTKK
jgi:hypothetical protein